MIVLDANPLLYAYDESSPHHSEAKVWLTSILTAPSPVGLPWLTVWAFLRIATNPRIFANPLPMEVALEIVQTWLDRPQVRLLNPTERHWSALQRMLIDGDIRGVRTSDAVLAALTIEYGGILQTMDRDFARFPGLRWVNPLAS